MSAFPLAWSVIMIPALVLSHSIESFILLGPMYLCGLVPLYFAYQEVKRVHRIKKNGTEYIGIITDHISDKTVITEGKCLVALQVRYYNEAGTIKEVIVPTGSYDKKNYPVGSCIRFIESEDKECIYVSEAKKFKGADDLLNIDVETSNVATVRRNLVSRTCPNCGATLMVSKYGKHKCRFCGQLVPYLEADKTSQGQR